MIFFYTSVFCHFEVIAPSVLMAKMFESSVCHDSSYIHAVVAHLPSTISVS